MSGQFPPKKVSVAILSRLCYLQRRLTGLLGRKTADLKLVSVTRAEVMLCVTELIVE